MAASWLLWITQAAALAVTSARVSVLAGLFSPCEPLEINRPCSSAVDSDESMPPKESGHDSVQALSSVHLDYGALEPSAVSRAFADAFQLESRSPANVWFGWVSSVLRGYRISVDLKSLPCCSRFWLCCFLVYLRLNAYAVVVMGSIAEMDGYWVGLDGPLSTDTV
ncbi:hypothetical protein Nepgr_022795 [Nepenthes gracilis]|uniref:Secreted protein n=1 Tax=Nepenthes gracilis TaxID=150966 RepID=A0AAD3XXB9_NEPGR|nr:hypothetical protein Nepgr_022795 [Nepenthes gracilis]